MAIVVNHNLPAMNANRMLNINNNALSKSLEKLSSGLKINRAADDASGLSISEKMRAQVRGLDQASANSEDGVSLIQTADGALDTTEQMLQRMRELTVKGTTETLADEDLQAITDEMKTLAEGINQIAERTEFNTKKLLTGNLGQTTVKATASFTTDEATTVSGTNLTATAGKTVSAGTTVKLTSSYTTNATDSAVKIVAQDGDTKVKINSGDNMTAGTTVTDVDSLKFNKSVQLEYIAGGKHNVANTTTTITAGASLTTNAATTFDKTVKVTSDTGTTIANTSNVTLTAGTSINIITASTEIKIDHVIKAGATGANIAVSASGTLTAGTTFTVGADSDVTAFSGKVVDSEGNEYSGTVNLTKGTYTVLEEGTATIAGSKKITLVVSAGGTLTRDGSINTKYDISSDFTVTISKTGKITGQATTTNLAAGETITKTAGSSIAGGNTVETIASTKIKTAGDVDINVAAGGTVTITAGVSISSNDAKYNINTIYDGTTLATAGATANVSLKEGESVTVTAGRTLTAGTTFQLGIDKQFATDAKVSGDKLAVSAGTTVTAGTSYETNNDMVIQTGANAAQVTKFTIGNMAFSAITTNNTGADITKTDTTYGTAAVTYSAGASIVASAITTETACSQETLLALDVAINAVSTQRSKLGAVQNQLEYTIKNLDNTSENLSSAESRIRDTDMAKEMMNYTKYNILSQASQSMLAQANQQPQSVLSLLQ